MDLPGKIKKHLKYNIWYHATTLDKWNSICEKGVLAAYNKETSDALDFGYGFYLNPTKERAEKYITNLLNVGVLGDKLPIILGFELYPLEYFEKEIYNTKILNAYDDEFALFVFNNRTENIDGNKQHNYDIIFGVMSDSVPTKVIMEYKMGILPKEDVLKALKTQTSMKQLSVHNQELCDILKLKEAYILDITEGNREELNINDYCNN